MTVIESKQKCNRFGWSDTAVIIFKSVTLKDIEASRTNIIT